MALNHRIKKILKILSMNEIKVDESIRLADLKRFDPMRIFYKKADYTVNREGYLIPVRIFYPNRNIFETKKKRTRNVMVFFHGGGWVTDSIDSYERICAKLSTATNHMVIAVNYRLAPEFKFPIGLDDCYEVTKTIFKDVEAEYITLIGDSAGGNLAAALSLLARDRQEFLPHRQILIYPAVSGDYSTSSPYPSVHENGQDYVLTIGKLQDYTSLYRLKEEDKTNPYYAPLLAEDFSHQPDTLIITAEFDPLRDEGEVYGKKIKESRELCGSAPDS